MLLYQWCTVTQISNLHPGLRQRRAKFGQLVACSPFTSAMRPAIHIAINRKRFLGREGALCPNPLNSSNWIPRIVRQLGYKHTFCQIVVSTENLLFFLYFRKNKIWLNVAECAGSAKFFASTVKLCIGGSQQMAVLRAIYSVWRIINLSAFEQKYYSRTALYDVQYDILLIPKCVWTEVPSHINLTVTVLGFVACKFRNRKVRWWLIVPAW